LWCVILRLVSIRITFFKQTSHNPLRSHATFLFLYNPAAKTKINDIHLFYGGHFIRRVDVFIPGMFIAASISQNSFLYYEGETKHVARNGADDETLMLV
jgi:hypothetical protein